MTPPRMLPRWAGWLGLVTVVVAIIVVPFLAFGEEVERWSLDRLAEIQARPFLAAGAVIALLSADVLLPIPSSIVSTLAGVSLGATGGTVASFLGMTAGCAVGYAVGRSVGRPAAGRLIGTVEMARLEEAFARFGDWAVVATRAVPVLAEATAIFAGMSRMRTGRFFALAGLSNLGISAVYAGVGAYAANVESFLLAVAAALLFPLVPVLWLRRGGRRGARA